MGDRQGYASTYGQHVGYAANILEAGAGKSGSRVRIPESGFHG